MLILHTFLFVLEGLRNRKAVEVAETNVKSFSWKEIAKHNTQESCWVSIDGKVYDITSKSSSDVHSPDYFAKLLKYDVDWIGKHPGGKEVLLLTAGRDISTLFETYHPFTRKAHEILPKYEIGVVIDHEFPPYKNEHTFYDDVRHSVNKYFIENKIDPKSPVGGLWRMAIVMPLAITANYLTFGASSLGFPARIFFAILFGICQALPLLHVMHDCSHTSFGHSEVWWKFWGRLFMDFYVGCSMTSWHNQHTIGHHVYTNIFKADPDIPMHEKDGDLRRIVKRQAWAYVSKFQHIYLPILYGFLGMAMRYADIFEVFSRLRNGPVRVNPHRLSGHVEHIASKLFFLFWRVYLPLAFGGCSLKEFLILFAIVELTTGYWLAFNFQVTYEDAAK